MARYLTPIESAAAVAADTVFANIAASAGAQVKLRRLILGCRLTTAADPTNRQISVAIYRVTNRGTSTSTTTPAQMEPGAPNSAITGVDKAWSTPPTLGSQLAIISFNTQGGADIPFEGAEELVAAAGSANNGLALRNLANALPSGHVITVTIETEE